MKFFKKVVATAFIVVALFGLFWLSLGFWSNPLAESDGWSWTVRVADREGRLLKDFLPPRMARREARPLSDFSPNLVAAVLSTEDKRFYRHLGVDPLAMLRAAWINLRQGRIVTGGSTITMQVARLNRGLSPGPRTMERKVREIWWALLIERHNTKDEILAEYLNRAPCGNLTEGFPAAARLYLDKSVADLSVAESAFLAALPASPGALNPYKDPRPALARQAKILGRMESLGFISATEAKNSKNEPLSLSNQANIFNAPHFVSYLRRHLGPKPPAVISTTLDLDLQRLVEQQVRETADLYRNDGLNQAAVVVMTLPEREILAWVGSSDFFEAQKGQNDGVTAPRQPGSALKPFIYAWAFDKGLISPASLIDDSAADYRAPKGSFSPANYSGSFHGKVSARLALASSLNLPAIKLAEASGVPPLLNLLRALGLESLDQDAEHYGLGLALGGGEVDLLSLTSAYASLADKGMFLSPVMTLGQATASQAPRPVFSPGAAFLISDILSDSTARETGFGQGSILDTPYTAAVKTGTSKSFRDNWCLGYSGSFVIGVWAGNFEASPMNRVSGVTGAGAIWRAVADIMTERYPSTTVWERPDDVLALAVCPYSGLPAGPDCPNHKLEFFLQNSPRPDNCPHLELEQAGLMAAAVPIVGQHSQFNLMRPLNGEIYAWDPGIKTQVQNIKAQVQSVPGVDQLIWKLNGRELNRQPAEGFARYSCLVPLARGRATLEVIGLQQGREIHSSQVHYTVK